MNLVKMFVVGAAAVYLAEYVSSMPSVVALGGSYPAVVKYGVAGAAVMAGHRFLKT